MVKFDQQVSVPQCFLVVNWWWKNSLMIPLNFKKSILNNKPKRVICKVFQTFIWQTNKQKYRLQKKRSFFSKLCSVTFRKWSKYIFPGKSKNKSFGRTLIRRRIRPGNFKSFYESNESSLLKISAYFVLKIIFFYVMRLRNFLPVVFFISVANLLASTTTIYSLQRLSFFTNEYSFQFSLFGNDISSSYSEKETIFNTIFGHIFLINWNQQRQRAVKS